MKFMEIVNLQIQFRDLLNFYRQHLLEFVMPFWYRHGFSAGRGGIDTCLDNDGSLLSTDRFMWSQTRAIWTFSALYNRIEKQDKWLDYATKVYDFACRYGHDSRCRWNYRLSAEGKVLEGPISIYIDGFAIYGLSEYYKATGKKEALSLAMDTAQEVVKRLQDLAALPTAPLPIPSGYKAHGIPMIFSHVFDELAAVTEDSQISDVALLLHRQVMDCFLQPERRFLLEFIGLDDQPIDSSVGRTVVPGHAIESMWFQLHLMQRRNTCDNLKLALDCIRWHLEAGWDEEFGGLYHAISIDGKEPSWRFPDAKLWWPATEALYALLLAYHLSKESWCLDWYRSIHNYSFAHYPNRQGGEWFQRLDRRGNVIKEVVALPVKDPFHLPRALIYIIKILEKMNAE